MFDALAQRFSGIFSGLGRDGKLTEKNIDELAAGIKDRGGELTMDPTDQEWGARIFALADPDGFKISFSTPMAGE